MKLLTMIILTQLFISSCALAQKANYYRVWQGFKKTELTNEQFLNELPTFMEDTVNLYKERALNQYLVVLPPKNAPTYIPDEFALVALFSEKNYRDIRNTEEGRNYGARHWDVFNRDNSRSSDFHNFEQDQISELVQNHAYDMFGKPVDWTKGHTMFYLGLRNKQNPPRVFLENLKLHIQTVKNKFSKFGLKGYIVIANENYEAAYLNWKSKKHMEKAMNSIEGIKIQKEANELLDTLMFTTPINYTVDEVQPNRFIRTL